MKQILYGFFLCAGLVGLGYAAHSFAETYFTPNPLFNPLPVDKAGTLLVPYTQSQNDMTILYGKLDGLSNQIQNLSQLLEQTFKACSR